MKPLYYAMLKWMTTVNEACVADAIDALKGEYGSFKMCRPKPMQEALMTAEKNGLLEESSFDMDEHNELRVYYKVTDYGKQMINDYIN
ncbi:MAG: hypothetical protein MR004_03525 [Clostridiales bacterium]|nr:hypothetical protein [Clostridiales bacterium]MDY4036645.1 hypothetical protein [Candidatus Pseudoscilispira sp.]